MSEQRNPETPADDKRVGDIEPADQNVPASPLREEIGGRGGLDPTRYSDWEKNGRCIDF